MAEQKKVKIGQNRNFYYDFTAELAPDSQEISRLDNGRHVFRATFHCGPGDFILLSTKQNLLELNGVPVTELSPNYVSPSSFRYGLRVHFAEASNTIEALLEDYDEDEGGYAVSLIRPEEPLRKPVADFVREIPLFPFQEPSQETAQVPDLSAYTPGTGRKLSPGRFGFLKGDGVLDCAMPDLGIIDKRYVSSHSEYRKPYRWGYATCPAGTLNKAPVKVNHLSVVWGAPEFNCTYSLATPGIISESNTGTLQLRELEFAGNYQYMMTAGRIASLDQPDLKMKQNWLLLFGATEFPDLPILIVLDKQPREIIVKRNQLGRLSEIQFVGNSLMITATPFGMEFFKPISPNDDDMIRRMAERAQFWSRALLAYPVEVVEYFHNDHAKARTSIVQKFSYRYIRDEWGTVPLETAPLPPVFTLSGNDWSKYVDFAFPTKYGYLVGKYGVFSEYSIPMMLTRRKFPLRSADSKIPQILKEGLHEYFAFHDQFPATVQAYPYSGSLMEPFALATTMMNFMDEEAQNKLAALAGERLEMACDRYRQYDYPIISHSHMMQTMPDMDKVVEIYKSPDMKHIRMWNWYERQEPYTGIKYHICYLNLGLLSTGLIKTGTQEEIASLKMPLVENDWGLGLTLYYMYLCALASGDFTPIKKNWHLICSAYSFFDKMCDWACMGTGYSDNACTWVEGANYGAFTAFVNMAEAIGEEKDYELGVYLAAKQFALRTGLFRSAQHYFCHWFEEEPWYINKGFREEQLAGFGFTHVPEEHLLSSKRLYYTGFYNMTTEGIYPEIFEGVRECLPEDYQEVMPLVRSELPVSRREPKSSDWGSMQVRASFLSNDALDPAIPEESVLNHLADAEKNGLLMQEWRGIHIFSRLLPKNWFRCQILAWLEMRKHRLWLEHWEGARINKALWDGQRAVIILTLTGSSPARLLIGIRGICASACLNGNSIPCKLLGKSSVELLLPQSGNLEITVS
jgi:hypothetical protein